MLRFYVTLFLVIFSTLSTSHAAINSQTSKILKPVKSDITAARHLAQILKKIDKNRYSSPEIKQFFKVDRAKTFLSYTEDLNFLIRLKKKNGFEQLSKECSKYYKSRGKRNFKQMLVRAISSLCHRRTIETVKNKKSLIEDDKVQAYFLDNLIFITKQHPQSFGEILETFMFEKQDKYLYFADRIYKKFIELEHSPSFRVLAHLPPSDSFTRYLQNKSDLRGKANQKVYDRELSGLYRKVKSNLNSPRKVRKNINEYIRFYLLNKENITKGRALRHVQIITRNLATKKYIGDGKNLVRSFTKVFRTDSEEEHELLFAELWIDLINDNFDNAHATIKERGLMQRYSSLSSKLKFWVPYIIKKDGDKKTALELYQNFIDEGDINYYSILANKEVALLKNAKVETDIKKLGKQKNLHFAHHEKINIRRILTWLELDYITFAQLEMKQLMTSLKNNSKKSLIYKVSEILNDQGQYLFTFKTLYGALNKNMVSYNDRVVENLFPTAFFNDVKKHSAEIDPIIVLSLIRQESAFNPEAKSRVGAQGLMQLMPATARQFRKSVKIKQLKDPEVNLKIGIQYLTKLFNMYEGNIVHTLSAYNAGEGRVKRWKKELFKSTDPLVNVEAIPFEETQNYVKLIYRNIYFYKNIMKENIQFKSLKETFFVATKKVSLSDLN